MPQAPPDFGIDDPFCSGHALSSSGQPIFVGGTNHVADCLDGSGQDLPWGHRQAWVFDNADYIRGAPPYPAFYPTNHFERERWYPTLLQTGDNRMVVFGHFGYPDYTPETTRTRERATWTEPVGMTPGALSWESTAEDFKNYEWPGPACSVPPAPITLGDYPRIHQLANGSAILVRNRGYVLDFNKCPVAENERFLPLAGSSPQPQSESNTTVHYVDLRDQLDMDEWIVSIAGADREAGCDDPNATPPYLLAESDEVVYMKDPAPGAIWSSLPSLKKSRTEANAVVGLNGEIVVFGGYGRNAAGNLVARMIPELLRPSFEPGFLFGQSLASEAWTLQCPMELPHTYHAVAGLLEDGRMVVGGGRFACNGTILDAGAHAMEIFSPPGLFGGPRPRIQSVSDTELDYSPDPINPFKFDIEVLLQGGSEDEFRVALTRPASVTHAFDNNQRYVVLRVDPSLSVFVEAPAKSTVSVFNPTILQQNAVPPGYYMLTVVNAAGRPAPAKWIRMVPP